MNVKLENLEINGYMIYQDKDSFNFGIDAVLLANFALREFGACIARPHEDTASIHPHEGSQCIESKEMTLGIPSIKICDFCTGALPIPLIMYAKRNAFKGYSIKIDAFEIDEEQVALCNKSIAYNKENVIDAKNICDDIKVFNDDIKNIFLDKEKYKNLYESYDMITVNPPYNKKGSGIINLNDKKIEARHEVSITFDDICKAARLILKSNKKFYLIHHSDRLSEIISTLKSNSFEVKKLQFIHQNISKPSTLVLIEAVKNANSGLNVLSPIIVFENDGNYTKNILNIYGK